MCCFSVFLLTYQISFKWHHPYWSYDVGSFFHDFGRAVTYIPGYIFSDIGHFRTY